MYIWHFNNIMLKVWLQHHTTAAPPPLLIGFTDVSDHPKMGKVLKSCGPQFSMVPFRIASSFWSRAMQSAGVQGLQWGSLLSSF
jgi:hypothetical protein